MSELDWRTRRAIRASAGCAPRSTLFLIIILAGARDTVSAVPELLMAIGYDLPGNDEVSELSLHCVRDRWKILPLSVYLKVERLELQSDVELRHTAPLRNRTTALARGVELVYHLCFIFLPMFCHLPNSLSTMPYGRHPVS
jgi:hypothetical protein